MEEADIRVSGLGVGKVRLDVAKIRGEGGEHDPQLVIPIDIELSQQPREHQIFLVRLSAWCLRCPFTVAVHSLGLRSPG